MGRRFVRSRIHEESRLEIGRYFVLHVEKACLSHYGWENIRRPGAAFSLQKRARKGRIFLLQRLQPTTALFRKKVLTFHRVDRIQW